MSEAAAASPPPPKKELSPNIAAKREIHAQYPKGGAGPTAGWTQDYNFSGMIFDPYYYYLRLPNLSNMVRRATLSPGYGPWDLIGDILAYNSVTDVLPPRDKPIDEGIGPFHDFFAGAGGGFAYDKAYYPNRSIDPDVRFRFVTPYFWNPMTDYFSVLTTSAFQRCSTLEIKALECFEYYGMKKGMEVCDDYYNDFLECTRLPKQKMRIAAIRMEQNKRWIEYMKGERDYDMYHPLPKPHAYNEPFKYPKWDY